SSSQGAYYEYADLYALSNSLSNSSFEDITLSQYWTPGNFPVQWRTFGDVAAEGVSSAELAETFGGMKLFVSGRNGGVRSSYIRIEGGKKYDGSIYAKGNGGVRISFFDENFACVGTGEATAFSSENFKIYKTLATAPETAKYAALELTATEGQQFICDKAEFAPGIPEIADDTQMFIDDYIIDETNLTRTFHQGKKTEPVFQGEKDYWENGGQYIYGTVMYDEEEQLYKMWYQTFNKDKVSGGDAAAVMAAYATSEDGENWTKPQLGIVSYPESAGGESTTNNNLMGNAHIMSVFKDNEAPASQRYKMITYGHGGYYICRYSPDGVNWTDGGKVHNGADVITAARDADGTYYGTAKLQNEIMRRDFWTFTGNDVNDLETSVPANSLADMIDAKSVYRSDSYGMGLYDKDGVYVGFNWLFFLTGHTYGEGIIEPNIAFSRDLKEEWQRPTRDAMIPLGEEGSIDDGMIFTASYATEVGDEIWMFCGGWDGDHGISDRNAAIYITKWRMDGFASLDGTGTLKTKPVIFDGGALNLNANGAKGAIRVELQDENGTPIPGYTKADCDAITTDSVKHTVSWNGKTDVSALSGTPVTVCITAENSEIYSFAFGENDGVSVKMYQNGEKIDALVNGNVDVKIQTGSEFAGKTGVLMLAVYEGKELLRIVSADRKTYQGGEETTFPLTGLAIKENTTYTGKVFFWENFANAKPLRGATEYQLK
ncbi:MAG: hypothetical protein IJC78_05875, partial [Clostridia bacterium]|nr:hypothetical protein [Clostridia bacterium]